LNIPSGEQPKENNRFDSGQLTACIELRGIELKENSVQLELNASVEQRAGTTVAKKDAASGVSARIES
jgi:hypothetical protein